MTDRNHLVALYGLEGKVAVVSGGAVGTGKAIAEFFADAGASVVVADINRNAANELVGDARGRGVELEAVETDITDEASVDRALGQIVADHGRIDVLVNNAGIYPKALLEYPLDLWEETQAVNLRGMFLMTRGVARSMVDRGAGGSVVNIGAVSAFNPGLVGNCAYATSKGGMVAFTQAAALDLAPHGIRVNVLCPAGYDVEGRGTPPVSLSGDRILLGRSGTPPIAAATLFLASDAASHITGQTLIADGGYMVS